MDPNIPGHGSVRDEPAYWRRRVFVLGAVVGAVGLLAWGCSAGASVPRAAPQSGGASSPATRQIAAAGALPMSTARPSRKAHSRAHSKRAHATRAHRPRGNCTPGKMVISLSASQQIFSPQVAPQFTIYVVNMDARTCIFDAGPRSLRLVLKSGPVYSWGSGDCARGTAPQMVRLSPGVPFVKHVSWDRKRSEPGCRSPRTVALPGTYTATAVYGADHSGTAVFILH
jgi:hypothetical protein